MIPSSHSTNADQTVSVLVTAGPTHEPIDGVRYLANRSSGRMGTAIAQAAAQRGYPTTLLLGPVDWDPSSLYSHLNVLRFQTAADLQRLLRDTFEECTLLIMAAAVADYTPRLAGVDAADPSRTKMRRSAGGLTLELRPTPDLLAELAALRRPGQQVVGFALEPPERLEEAARAKLRRKSLDAIVANPLATMDSDTIAARLLTPAGGWLAPPGYPEPISKTSFAQWLIDQLVPGTSG